MKQKKVACDVRFLTTGLFALERYCLQIPSLFIPYSSQFRRFLHDDVFPPPPLRGMFSHDGVCCFERKRRCTNAGAAGAAAAIGADYPRRDRSNAFVDRNSKRAAMPPHSGCIMPKGRQIRLLNSHRLRKSSRTTTVCFRKTTGCVRGITPRISVRARIPSM